MTEQWLDLGRGTGKRPDGVQYDDVVRARVPKTRHWQEDDAKNYAWSLNIEYQLLVRTPADSDVLREALLEHHNWHLAQKTPDAEHGYIPAEEYAESGLCERTIAALCHTKAQD